MPRYAQPREFQLGDYWLSQRSGSPAWHRTWFDPKTRQTRRVSLGTADFAEAKQRLTDWFILAQTQQQQPLDDILLAEVFARFFDQHGQTLNSADDVRRILNDWLTFHGEATVQEATSQHAQEQFRAWLATKRNLSAATVRKTLLTGKAALNWAWKRGEIAQVPYIPLVKPPRPEPKGRPLEVEEVAQLFRAATEPHLTVFMAFMLGTAARTAAVLDLTLGQIDTQRDLITLNPAGRRQTLKFRPTVKLPSQLRRYCLARHNDGADASLVRFNGARVNSIKTSWRRLRRASGVTGNVQTYSFRHTMARWLRMRGVPAWEVAAQLGHKAPDYSTTEIYAPFDPAYLAKSVAAIDAFLSEVAAMLEAPDMSAVLLR